MCSSFAFEDIERNTEHIPIKPIKVNHSLLKQLCKIIVTEHSDFKKKNPDEIFNWLYYSTYRKDEHGKLELIESSDSTKFLKEAFSLDFREINMDFHGGEQKQIRITLSQFSYYNEVAITSEDTVWRKDIRSKIESVFQKFRTRKTFFTKRKDIHFILGWPVSLPLTFISF